jgi:hypothetical protein
MPYAVIAALERAARLAQDFSLDAYLKAPASVMG